MFRNRLAATDQTKAENQQAVSFGGRVLTPFRKVRQALATIANHILVRVIIVAVGVSLFKAKVGIVGLRLAESVFANGGKPLNDLYDLREALLWFFFGYFILIALAKKLPRAVVVVLLILSCVLYGLFLTAHVVDFDQVLRPYEDDLQLLLMATPALVVAQEAPYIWASVPFPLFSVIGFFFIVSVLIEHLLFLLCISFLYEVAFGLYKVGGPARDRETKANSG